GMSCGVWLPARQAAAVRAVAGFAPWPAPGDLASGGEGAGVDGAEGGGGEGGEHARVDGHGFGHAFATGEPGADELVGVGAVGLGAWRADRGAGGAGPDVDRPG